jgi:NADH-quinone oxidoreductase subunit K
MFLFVIAYLGGRAAAPFAGGPTFMRAAAVVAAAAIAAEVIVVIVLAAGDQLDETTKAPEDFGSPASIGTLFLSDHLLAFEVTSIILLVAAVGGVILGSTVPPQFRSEARRERVGPGIASYLIVSVVLFAIGAFGVLVRRSPLIVLLALELMLNAGNLALIAFARQTGTEDGQIFALAVMVVAASEAVVGLGFIVAMSRLKADLDVDKLTSLRG